MKFNVKFCEISKSQNRVLYMSTLVMLFSVNQRQGYEDLPGGPDAKINEKKQNSFQIPGFLMKMTNRKG